MGRKPPKLPILRLSSQILAVTRASAGVWAPSSPSPSGDWGQSVSTVGFGVISSNLGPETRLRPFSEPPNLPIWVRFRGEGSPVSPPRAVTKAIPRGWGGSLGQFWGCGISPEGFGLSVIPRWTNRVPWPFKAEVRWPFNPRTGAAGGGVCVKGGG